MPNEDFKYIISVTKAGMIVLNLVMFGIEYPLIGFASHEMFARFIQDLKTIQENEIQRKIPIPKAFLEAFNEKED